MSGTPWSQGRILAGPGRGPRLLFGRMYEDPRIELAAFPAAPARVLCIASAGDTAAALAGAGYEVTAVDVNPVQLRYAEARLYDGAPVATGAAELMLAAGRRTGAALLLAWQPASLAGFLALEDPAAQLTWWHRRLDSRGLRLLMGAALRPAGALTATLAPGFRACVPPRFDTVLRERIRRTIARHPNADNPLLAALFLGSAPRNVRVPRGAVRFLRADVAEHLETVPVRSYDAVTLSNVLDGPGRPFARRLRAAVERAVRPGGVAVLRSVREASGPATDVAAAERCPLWGTVRTRRIGGLPA
jgi:hypothetical protein